MKLSKKIRKRTLGKKSAHKKVSANNNQKKKISQRDVNKGFFEIGKLVSTLPLGKGIVTLKPAKSYKEGFVESLLKRKRKIIKDKDFNQAYRNVQPGHDEIVATSAMREIYKGVLAGNKDVKKLTPLFEMVSRARIPTQYAGFAVKGDKMQHPTAKGTGMFADSEKTAKAHAAEDKARRLVTLKGMQEAAKRPGRTATSVIAAGAIRALRYSTNRFIAPATGKGVSINPGAKIKKEKEKQVAAREALKALEKKLSDAIAQPPKVPRKKAIRKTGKSGVSKSNKTDKSATRMWKQFKRDEAGYRSSSEERTTSSKKGITDVLQVV